MANYVYAVLYSQDARFLICRKVDFAYFFHKPGGGPDQGNIYENGKEIRNGPGTWNLPGGGLNTRGMSPYYATPFWKNLVAEAARELYEETALRVPPVSAVDCQQWTNGSDTFYAVYFRVDSAALDGALQAISRSLGYAGIAAGEINRGRITSYAEIFQAFPECPPDNEQSIAEIWSLVTDWSSRISPLQSGQYTDWFYEILLHLRDSLSHRHTPSPQTKRRPSRSRSLPAK
jgi:8-oxo-dGTP pyrophosphatase MutT (NUDIX family)